MPVPLSPVTRSVVLDRATFSTMARTSSMAELLPTISTDSLQRPVLRRSTWFSALSNRCSSAFSSTILSSSTLNGFCT